jgi:hypothetical protein
MHVYMCRGMCIYTSGSILNGITVNTEVMNEVDEGTCVYIYVCVYIFIYIYVYVYVYICMYIYIYVNMEVS